MKLLILFVILALCPAIGQNREEDAKKSLEQDAKKWLNCDIDILTSTYSVRPDFTVKVEFHGKPVSRLNVVLSPSGPTTAKGQKDAIVRGTGPNGVAKFLAVAPGKYSLGVQGLLGPGYNEVTVSISPKAPDHIVLDWPNIEYTVQHVSGRLVSPEQQLPLQNVGVEVLDPRSARKVAETRTDADGHYDLPVLDDGAYAFRVTPPGNTGRYTEAGVEVNSSSLKGEVPLLIFEDRECGTSVSGPE